MIEFEIKNLYKCSIATFWELRAKLLLEAKRLKSWKLEEKIHRTCFEVRMRRKFRY